MCVKGNLYNTWDNTFMQWRENCTHCNFSRLHPCRRKRQVEIDFEDRRRNEQVNARPPTPHEQDDSTT